MKIRDEQSTLEFDKFPPVGTEDWDYAFACAQVRVLDTMLLPKSTLLDMANADSFETAVEMLNGTDYAMGNPSPTLGQAEEVLIKVRSDARELFCSLIDNEDMAELLRAREDFANMRLAIRRVVTERPIGTEYSDHGSVPANDFEEIFEQEDYGRFPLYLQEGVEQAILGYYKNKDIREIDYGIDKAQAAYWICKSTEIGSVFLLSHFRTRIDLINLKTMLRLKMAERDERDHFIDGGFVTKDLFINGLDTAYESLAALFYPTTYDEIIEGAVSYLNSDQSFLALERLCDEHTLGFLRSAMYITAGHQPVLAYGLIKENEVRNVRMILTAKKNALESKLILDRLPN